MYRFREFCWSYELNTFWLDVVIRRVRQNLAGNDWEFISHSLLFRFAPFLLRSKPLFCAFNALSGDRQDSSAPPLPVIRNYTEVNLCPLPASDTLPLTFLGRPPVVAQNISLTETRARNIASPKPFANAIRISPAPYAWSMVHRGR